MNKVIYFDFDGTLHDTAFIYHKAVQEAYDYLKTKISLPDRTIGLTEAAKWLGFSPPDMWNDFMPDLTAGLQKEASMLVGKSMIAQLQGGKGKLYHGTKEVLNELLARGYGLKVLSNCKEAYGKTSMEVFDLSGLIIEFHCAETYQFKPKYDIIREIKGNDHIVGFVGDRQSDIDVGSELGIFTVACDYGFGEAEELLKADEHISDISGLLDLFD